MVKISRLNFNKEMDAYISKRKSSGSRSLLSRVIKEDKQEEQPSMYKVDPKTGRSLDPKYEQPKTRMRKDDYPTFGNKEERENYEAMDGEYERRPGFFARIIKIFSVAPEEEEEEMAVDMKDEPMGSTSDAEIKDVLRITVRWLKLLPPEDIDEIKDSEEFKRYKALLKKYNLIK